MSSVKIQRINSELVKTISEILMTETNDALLKTITITAADTTSDLSFAKIYFTSISATPKSELEKEVNEASDLVRKFVAERMDMRQTPKLKFIYDESIAYGNKIESILDDIHKKEQ